MKTYRKYYRNPLRNSTKRNRTKRNRTKRNRKQSGGGCNSSILDQYVNSNITMLTQSNIHSVKQFTQKSDEAFDFMKKTPGHYLEKINCRVKMIESGKKEDAERKLIVFKELIQRLSNEFIIKVDRLTESLQHDYE